ncbi:hypothetical protein AB1Y20_009791 [Prymnesium parvum]|uniref:Uncharacterized protein n=1 Tax=Prymnesium parvum TaxID=97485 RepID=A0AB34K7K2_PRYPA|mmetsp:Transcript_32397/g.74213  ORF Transcript_32397/g.74213 Transcript_32397/m.74213 type:complete len:129 (-) Transcript_32397:422-808(-)
MATMHRSSIVLAPGEPLPNKRRSMSRPKSNPTSAAASDLNDPSLADADARTVKLKAAEKMNELIDNLQTGQLGACQFDEQFLKVWPYAQARYGVQDDLDEHASPRVTPELARAVKNHPLALQHGEFSL